MCASRCCPSLEKKPASLKFLSDFQKHQRSFQYVFKILLKNAIYIWPKMLQYLCLSSRKYNLVRQFFFYELLGNVTRHAIE